MFEQDGLTKAWRPVRPEPFQYHPLVAFMRKLLGLGR